MPIEESIIINTSGAETASAAIGGVSQAMGGIIQGHDMLKNRFQERFQHIGLMLFAGDALRASGLGAETRMIVSTLSMALTSLGSVAGISSGGLFLVVTALTAIAGIAEKVIEHHKNQNEELKKLTDSEDKELSALQTSISEMDAYRSVVGKVPSSIQAVYDAKVLLRNFMEREEAETLRKNIVATAEQIVKDYEERIALEQQRQAYENLTAKKVVYLALTQGVSSAVVAAYMSHKNYSKELDANAEAMLKLNVQLQEAKQRLADVQNGIADSTAARKAEIQSIKDEAEAEKKADEETLKDLNEKAMDSYKVYEEQEKQHKAMYKQFEEHAKQAFNTINQAQSMAFAKMVVEGQSFQQATAHIWRDLAEQVIAQIEAMIVKLLILYALEQATGMGGGAAMASPLGKIAGFATGGSVVVDKPTLFLAGEGGPEVATFTPMNASSGAQPTSSGGGAGDIYIGTIETHVHGVTDPDEIADEVGDKILNRIRGMGELGFVRTA